MEHLFRVRADTDEQTEAGLDKKWPLDETLLPEIVQIMEVARVVAFELVARPRFVQRLERAADVLEGVAEDEVVAPLEHRRLPLVLKILVSLEHRKQSEVHRDHVEARDSRLPRRAWGEEN